jgi:2-keto-4-pentenoate hydratase/2-oxohepta-3-ene-1,7-dioic acid hydratase in catechol pathway
VEAGAAKVAGTEFAYKIAFDHPSQLFSDGYVDDRIQVPMSKVARLSYSFCSGKSVGLNFGY